MTRAILQPEVRLLIGHQSSLINLPTELLTLIIQQLDCDQLLDLACVCSLLHAIALQLFFANVGFSPKGPESSSVGVGGAGQPYSLLKAIRLSFTIKPLHQLHCQIRDSAVMEDMQQVRRLLILLPAVEGVSLRFPGRDYTLRRRRTDQSDEVISDGLVALLNALDGKSCIRLKIARLFSPTFQDSDRLYRTQEELQYLHTLQEVTLDTDGTLAGRIASWLSQSLQNSPVRTLAFTTHTMVDFTPVFVLQLPNLPNLTEVHFYGFGPSFDDLAPSLSRLPNLKLLHTTTSFKIDMSFKVHPLKVSLPHLTKLAAGPRFITHFLSLPEAMPALTTIHLLTAGWSDTQESEPYCPFSSSSMTETLTALSTSRNISSLSFTMNPFGMDHWMAEISGSVDSDADPQKHTNPVLVLPHIRQLAVFSASHIPPVFLRWLKVFPRLKSLVLDDIPAYCGETQFVGQLRERFPTLLEVAFSKDASPKPIAEWPIEDATLN